VKNLQRVLKVLLVGVAVLFAAYGGTEIYFRLSLRPPADPANYLYLWPPLRREVYTVGHAVPGLEPQRTVFTTNSLGIRGDEIDPGADDGRYRVVTLGGSVTECLLLNDEDAWPHLLQERLAKGSGRDVWVGNAGKSGQMTLDYAAHVKLLLPQLKPNLVVIMPGGNDLQAAVEDRLLPLDLRPTQNLYRYARTLYTPGPATLPIYDALEPSHTWFFFRRWRGAQEADIADFYTTMKNRRYQASKLDEIPDLDDHLHTYRANLEQIIDSMRDLPGAKLVMMTHPYIWKPDQPDAEERALWAGYSCMDCQNPKYYARKTMLAAIEAFNKTLLETCTARGIPCFDLASAMTRDLDHFYDDAHLKVAGSRQVADQLAGFLLEKGLLK
jgi:lysophospholipase L1-like esterase